MDGLKQRIIGALVLVSLAVIFVPMVFDEPHSERTSTNIKIPEEPPFPEVKAPEPDTDAPVTYDEPAGSGQSAGSSGGYRIVEEPAQAEQTAKDTDQQAPAAQGEAPAVAETAPTVSPEQPAEEAAPEAVAQEAESVEYARSLEGAWVVQLGSFGNADNAQRLRDRVRKAGYGSHLQQVTRGDTTLTRVFSGPFATKTRAEEAKRELDETFNVNSLVTTGDK